MAAMTLARYNRRGGHRVDTRVDTRVDARVDTRVDTCSDLLHPVATELLSLKHLLFVG